MLWYVKISGKSAFEVFFQHVNCSVNTKCIVEVVKKKRLYLLMDVVLYKNLILLYLPKCSQGLTSFFCEDEELAAK